MNGTLSAQTFNQIDNACQRTGAHDALAITRRGTAIREIPDGDPAGTSQDVRAAARCKAQW
ncbi:hypothetical protein [Paraburkholderia aspalathi]|uniref:hypothetical protein n=1 Tax=Paraburkholderia aspalathi TaxID=1324617 RepID=UPI003CA201BF